MTNRYEYLERFGSFRWLKLPVAGMSLSELGALMTGIDWAQVWPLTGLAITALGTAFIGLYRYFRLVEIELEERRRRMEQALTQTVVVSPDSPPIKNSPPPESPAPAEPFLSRENPP